jgi:hypothetical protein
VLARDGVQAEPHPLVPNALRVVANPRAVAASRAYTQGMVELQDVSSQLVAAMSGAAPGMRVLDYCAGGGGKTLALAALMENRGQLLAWDVNPRRMSDLPERAGRAGAAVRILDKPELDRLGPACGPGLRGRALLGKRRLAAQARRKVARDPRGDRSLSAAPGRDPRRRRGSREARRPARLRHLLAAARRERGPRRRLRRPPPRLASRCRPPSQPPGRGRRLFVARFRAPEAG